MTRSPIDWLGYFALAGVTVFMVYLVLVTALREAAPVREPPLSTIIAVFSGLVGVTVAERVFPGRPRRREG